MLSKNQMFADKYVSEYIDFKCRQSGSTDFKETGFSCRQSCWTDFKKMYFKQVCSLKFYYYLL